MNHNKLTRILDEVGGRHNVRFLNCPIITLPAGFAAMRATIDITGTQIDPATLPPELRAKINSEKPPGSKEWDKMIVLPKDKDKK